MSAGRATYVTRGNLKDYSRASRFFLASCYAAPSALRFIFIVNKNAATFYGRGNNLTQVRLS